MGIEIDSKYGGADSTFFASIVAIEELAKVDAAVSVVCDVQNTLINEYFRRYASVDLQEKYFPKLAKDLVSPPPPHTHTLSPITKDCLRHC